MKKLTLLFAALMAWMGFSATAAVGDVITDGTFYFNIVAEGDVNEVEIAPKPSGTYTITDRSIFGNYNTVTIGGVTYNVVGIGEGAFRNAQFPTQNITNLPSSLRYISDYAFQGVKSGKVDDADSNIRFYGTLLTLSPLAFVDNEIVGTINVSGGTEHFKQVACTASRIQYNTGNCYVPCKDGNTLVAIGGKGKILGNGSGGYKCANKLTLASELTIVGPHAFHGNSGYTQLDLGNVVEIQEYAFKNSVVEQLTLPATLTTVDPTAFEGASAIFSITCNATTPPAGCVFDDAVYASIRESGKITVPEGSLADYQADENWGRFWAAPPTPTKYTVTIADGIQNGTVTADKAEAEESETVTLTVTPAEGYQLETITVNPETLELIVEVNDNQFTMPADNVTVTATFSLIPPTKYAITIDENIQNGTVEADMIEAEEGETVTLTVTPAEGYQLKSITVTPETLELLVEVNENNQFTMPADNVTVTAEFEEIPPVVVESAVTFSAEIDHATIEVSVDGTPIESGALVAEGTEVTITVTPEEGYKVAGVTVETVDTAEPDGPAGMPRRADVNVNGEDNVYTFNMPAAPININVTMEQEVVTGVADLNVSSNKGVKYVNVMGQVSDRPFKGVNIVIDGDKTYKVIK
ncbi:MAG: leucine-rich repeat protein [Muribaculaceae bacterium]|nr:leucine-rich repeat protein [Muribaculaceae bacterium]